MHLVAVIFTFKNKVEPKCVHLLSDKKSEEHMLDDKLNLTQQMCNMIGLDIKQIQSVTLTDVTLEIAQKFVKSQS